jgi:hypothetical protein
MPKIGAGAGLRFFQQVTETDAPKAAEARAGAKSVLVGRNEPRKVLRARLRCGALRRCGVNDPIPGFGRLLREF